MEKIPEYNARYIRSAHKFVEGELTIRDVCAPCNNGPLSELDSYICQLYDAQFHRIARARQPQTFVYCYELLLRWLLKISYNSSRANHSNVNLLSRYKEFILKGGSPPQEVQVRLELVHPSPIPKHVHGSASRDVIPPQSVRCSRVELPNCPISGVTVRMVAINSYYFWIVFTPFGAETAVLEAALRGKKLFPTKKRLSLFSTRGMLEPHRDWVLDEKASESMQMFRARTGR